MDEQRPRGHAIAQATASAATVEERGLDAHGSIPVAKLTSGQQFLKFRDPANFPHKKDVSRPC
jgi:hypothetical protein